MTWIYDLTYDQLKEELKTTGIKPFVADQIFLWLYGKLEPHIENWSNISKTNRTLLERKFNATHIKTVRKLEDKEGTKKILFQLADGMNIESVSMKEKNHYTFCISTQVGCALGCKFCATGELGFKRNLSPGEILCQILVLKKELGDYTGKLNLVFMGMGEPLLNYQNLKQALHIITAEKGIAISPRNITISTAGILEIIKTFEHDFPKVKISFSLNASSPEQRITLMPISKSEKLEAILDYFRDTTQKRKHRITFEYVLLKGINDSPADAAKLVKLVHGTACKINLIPFNANENSPYQTPTLKQVEAFCEFLHTKGHTVIVRWSKGRDIKSACGQLAADSQKNET